MSKFFLIGLMGSGKTYWAERLKKKHKIPAYDLDNLVEIMEERSVAEIFKDDGEDFFRKEEAKMLRLFREKKQFILSCGGGTPCYNDNMTWMNKNGITIWINEPLDVLAERLKNGREHRPLLKDLNDDQLVPFLQTMLSKRVEYYSQATHILEPAELTDHFFNKIISQYA